MGLQGRTGNLPFEDGDLLTKREDLQSEIGAGTYQHAQGSQECEDKIDHETTVVTGGSSSEPLPNWRWAEQDLISEPQLLTRTFPGGRPNKSGRHHKWDKLFIRVKPAGQE